MLGWHSARSCNECAFRRERHVDAGRTAKASAEIYQTAMRQITAKGTATSPR